MQGFFMHKPHIVVVLQARMGATRLPGKPLMKVLGRELLSYEVERIRRAKSVDEVVVATTTNPADDKIVEFCQKEHIPYFRGSEDDVLDRYYQAAKHHKVDVVIRITGDCPLIDPVEIDRVVDYFLKGGVDYISNTLELTYPRGLDVEVFSFSQLERVQKEAKRPEEREHVTPYFYRHPELFSLVCVKSPVDLSHHRWTVDTQEDFDLIARIIAALYPKNKAFSMHDILELLKHHPDWVKINAHVVQKRLPPK